MPSVAAIPSTVSPPFAVSRPLPVSRALPVPAVVVPHVAMIAPMRSPWVIEAKREVRQEEPEVESRVPTRMTVVVDIMLPVPVAGAMPTGAAAGVRVAFFVAVAGSRRARNEERERDDGDASHREARRAGGARANCETGRVAFEHAAPPCA